LRFSACGTLMPPESGGDMDPPRVQLPDQPGQQSMVLFLLDLLKPIQWLSFARFGKSAKPPDSAATPPAAAWLTAKTRAAG
jgi:hypothetical protein